MSNEEEIKKLGQGPLFAIVKVQGQQYRVMEGSVCMFRRLLNVVWLVFTFFFFFFFFEGDVIMTQKIDGAEVGKPMSLSEVLLVGAEDMTIIGSPLVENASVETVVEEQTQTGKVIVFKKKRRQGYQRRKGFRSDVTVLRVTEVKRAKD